MPRADQIVTGTSALMFPDHLTGYDAYLLLLTEWFIRVSDYQSSREHQGLTFQA